MLPAELLHGELEPAPDSCWATAAVISPVSIVDKTYEYLGIQNRVMGWNDPLDRLLGRLLLVSLIFHLWKHHKQQMW